MVEFESQPTRKGCQDLSFLIEQLTLRSAPKKPNPSNGCSPEKLKPEAEAAQQDKIPDSLGP